MKILAIAAHPDDIEINCAGTLARCVTRGDEVTMAVACNGEFGGREEHGTVGQLVKTRRAEATASSKLLGAKEVIFIGLSDGAVDLNDENKRRFVDVVRRAEPDLVITHCHDDYQGDHNNTYALTLDATMYAAVPNFKSNLLPIKAVPCLCMMEPLVGYNFQPEVYVDITDTLETKIRMMECHKSQIEMLSSFDALDIVEYIRTLARFRGFQSRTRYAEGFIYHKSWFHIPSKPMLP